MSLLLITNPPTVFLNSSEWTDFVLRSNANMLGTGLSIPTFTLTNWDATTTQPLIAKDSIIEAGGSFYKADADTALVDDAGLIDGTVHIKLVPAGGGASVVPTLTNDVIPAWDANKAGWYDVLDKFLPYEMTKATAVFTVKSEYVSQGKTVKRLWDDSFYDLTVTNDLTVENGSIIPITPQPEGSWAFTVAGETQLIPRGIYLIKMLIGDGSPPYADIEIYIDGGWEIYAYGQSSVNTDRAKVVVSDGVNYRVRFQTLGASGSVLFRKA